jgi:class 3 adenylate cyclase
MSERLSAKRVELAAAPGMYADGHGLYLRVGPDIVFILNRYFEAMGRAVEAAGGRLDKFIGAGVMALFGIEADSGAACRYALAAARLMSSHLADLNEVTRHFVAQWERSPLLAENLFDPVEPPNMP